MLVSAATHLHYPGFIVVRDRATYTRFWEETFVLLLHPTQLLILEALSRLGLPVSATVMEQIADGQIPLANYHHHFIRLESLGILELVRSEPRRGVREKFSDLRLTKVDKVLTDLGDAGQERRPLRLSHSVSEHS